MPRRMRPPGLRQPGKNEAAVCSRFSGRPYHFDVRIMELQSGNLIRYGHAQTIVLVLRRGGQRTQGSIILNCRRDEQLN